ncbi:MAG: acetylxylan esterase [Planctomycetales bacterium]|nr:acetylxylan esterase [Planctomycetales bacterium]
MFLPRAVLVIALAAMSLPRVAAEELSCLTESERTVATLYYQLQQRAYAALDRRDEVVEKLTDPAAIRERQQKLRRLMLRQLGGLPKKSPLHARTVRKLDCDGYTVECVIFDSQPGHRITANFYLPVSKGAGKFPGVAVSSGHSRTGKTADYNQRFGIAMARQGIAALCFDPIGQGERSQILKDNGQPQFSGTTTEHFLVGVGSILVGRNTARYRVWDAMRAIDYLCERPEVDATRIGFTGCSGGGTLTSYVMALDDRVACAAPACYLTNFRRLIESIGPQDAEQNIFGQLAAGLDQPDYVLMRAPQPTLISSTTDDFFSIRGSWETFREAKRIYGRLGYPERVELVEVAGKHGVQPQNLATISHWMRRWLLESDSPVSVAEFPTLPPEKLLCTPAGQVLPTDGEQSVFDLNASHQQQLARQREMIWRDGKPEELAVQIAQKIGTPDPRQRATPKWEDRGRVKRDGWHIDKLVLKTSSGATLPGLTFHPQSPVDDAYLYLHDRGKLGDTQADGPIEKLVADGYVVVTVDLRGQGETGTAADNDLLGDWKSYYLAYLLGESLVGLRVEDALAAADFVANYQRPPGDPRKVHLVGAGQASVIALHAAALAPTRFASVTLRGGPRDWSSIVSQTVPAGQLESTVHGALELYDLPNLLDLAGPERVKRED